MMGRRFLVVVDKLRAVRRPRGGHLSANVGNVRFSSDGRSVRLTIEVDGVDGILELTQAQARDLAADLRDAADEARNADEKSGGVDQQLLRGGGIYCPCCERTSTKLDVWYDCQCFSGANADVKAAFCVNCARLPAERDSRIASNMRARGWDKSPSPAMRDYLTPGWRA